MLRYFQRLIFLIRLPKGEFKLGELILLLVVQRCVALRDSYSLNKILAWRFKIIYLSKIRESLVSKNYVTTTLVKAVHHYSITDIGIDYLNKNYDTLIKTLLAKYPEQKEFIDAVVSNRSQL